MKNWIAVDSRTPEKSGAYLVVVQGLSVRFADRAFYDVETNIWKRRSYLSSKHGALRIGCHFLNYQRRSDTWQHHRSVVVADRR